MYINDKTPSLFKNFFHLGTELDFDNRWFKIAELITWEKIDEVYGRYFSPDSGRPAIDSRLICGLFIVKYIKNLSDEEVIKEYFENPYIQAFCGRKYFLVNDKLNVSILSERRKRLGRDFFDYFEKEVIPIIEKQKYIKVNSPSQNKCFVCNFFEKIFSKLKNIFK